MSGVGEKRPDLAVSEAPRAGQGPVLSAALAIGILLLAIQLWMLTVALDLYLGGRGDRIWQLTLGSFVVFVGGVLSIRLLSGRLFR
jgi:hypothetical protein